MQTSISSMSSQLQSVAGTDGFINSKDYSTAKKAWVSAGYASKEFDTTFSVFRNPNDTYQVD
jgi:hypothetical protein